MTIKFSYFSVKNNTPLFSCRSNETPCVVMCPNIEVRDELALKNTSLKWSKERLKMLLAGILFQFVIKHPFCWQSDILGTEENYPDEHGYFYNKPWHVGFSLHFFLSHSTDRDFIVQQRFTMTIPCEPFKCLFESLGPWESMYCERANWIYFISINFYLVHVNN